MKKDLEFTKGSWSKGSVMVAGVQKSKPCSAQPDPGPLFGQRAPLTQEEVMCFTFVNNILTLPNAE